MRRPGSLAAFSAAFQVDQDYLGSGKDAAVDPDIDTDADSDSDSDDDHAGRCIWTDEESKDHEDDSDSACSDNEDDVSLERRIKARIMSMTIAEAHAILLTAAQLDNEKERTFDEEVDLGVMAIDDVEDGPIPIPPPKNPRRSSVGPGGDKRSWKKPITSLFKSVRGIVT